MNHDDYLREAISLAKFGVAQGDGGPFGAVVVHGDVIVGRGWNRVLATNDPTAHAEVVALREASQALASPHLSHCRVYASCEPCPMCLAACYWARVERVYFGATSADAEAIGFADDFIRRDFLLQPAQRSLPTIPLLRDEALTAFAAWQASDQRRIY